MNSYVKNAIEDGEISPEFLSDQEEALFAEAAMGREAIEFLNSDLGRVIRGHALYEIERCKRELLKTSPWRKRKIAKLQFDAAVANRLLAFIQDALNRGRIAESNLIQMRGH